MSDTAEARGWLYDSGIDADDLSDRDVRRVVDGQYSGGWAGFRADQNPPSSATGRRQS